MREHVILTASGRDRPGVLEEMTKLLLDYDGNVETSRMARLGGEFAMLMLVSTPAGRVDGLRAAVEALHRDDWEVQTRVTQVEGPVATPATYPCGITVAGADHLGIIHQIASYLARHGMNVETMNTAVVTAPMSGVPLFTMSGVVNVPDAVDTDRLRDELDELADDLGVDVSLRIEGA
jgi:glycine cleavage system transcriptional repressor